MKTRSTLLSILAALTISLVAVSCDDKNGTNNNDPVVVGQAEVLPSYIDKSVVLDANKSYAIKAPVLVKEGGQLTIPAGTVIVAEPGFNSYILVERGGKIFVNGTADKPVVMTSSKKEAGAWGGLIINGYAQLTQSNPEFNTEINPILQYGPGKDKSGKPAAPNNNDNSGSINYLILEYPGANMNDDTEHNGLTLNGVGNGTKIENVFVYKSADDAIEFFGGRVNVTNFLCVDADDDMFDFTQGYVGTLKNAYGIWNDGHVSTEKDPRGVEADGNHDGNYASDPDQTNFTIENVTIELNQKASTNEGLYMHDVFKVRRGCVGTITNALVKGQGQAKDFIDTTDGKGAGSLTINYKNALNASLSGKLENGTNIKATNDAAVTGTDANLFKWTGYDFAAKKYTSRVK